ncbi:hypothetical protein [Hydrogenophaga sp. ANAO-22]|jgi:hypothetical protein|uniref:hypothetical protein n=1 Tax=Hydrogenophaga sp. ANAO-22 TaxID=3166645 RepID=UPI0036D3CB0D
MNANFSPSTATARRSPWPHLLVWLPTLLLIVLWSLFAWAAHALAGWSGWTAWAGGGSGDWRAWIDALALPAWLAPWLPAESLEAVKAMLVAGAPLMEWLVASMPALMAWLPALVLAIWAAGAGLLVLGGVLGSVAVGIWRRKLQPALAGAR